MLRFSWWFVRIFLDCNLLAQCAKMFIYLFAVCNNLHKKAALKCMSCDWVKLLSFCTIAARFFFLFLLMLFCCSPPIFHYFIAHALLPYSGPCANVVFVAPVLWVQRPNMWAKARIMAELKSCLVTVFVLLFKCNKLYKFIIRYKRTEEWNSAHKVHMLLALQLSVGTYIHTVVSSRTPNVFVCWCVCIYIIRKIA